MKILNYEEWLSVQEAEAVLPSGLIYNVTEDVESIIENDGELEDIITYLYENYGIELDIDNFLYDLDEDEYDYLDEEDAPTEPKKTVGQKVGGHFKKHWKKYAAGAAGAAALGGAYYLGKKGKLGKKGEDVTASVDNTAKKVGGGVAGAAKKVGGGVAGAAKKVGSGAANTFNKIKGKIRVSRQRRKTLKGTGMHKAADAYNDLGESMEYIIENNIPESIEYIIENDGDINDIANYLYDNYGIELDKAAFLYDLNEEDAPNEPKKSIGQKVGGHFKKHWKKYAAGAGGAALLGGGYLAGQKGYLGKKGKEYAQKARAGAEKLKIAKPAEYAS